MKGGSPGMTINGRPVASYDAHPNPDGTTDLLVTWVGGGQTWFRGVGANPATVTLCGSQTVGKLTFGIPRSSDFPPPPKP